MMTSELEALKTNEFQRRRKLRLQQVREQSKEIAKKIRQRAKVEKSKYVENLDAKKCKEYLAHQEKLVQRLEELYVHRLNNIGTAHKNAELLNTEEKTSSRKTDLSKSRGKEAAVELRRKKQEQLDEQKRALDRKLQAREIANEISREKSSSVASKLTTKQSSNKSSEVNKNDAATETVDLDSDNDKVDKEVQINDKEAVTDNMDMQWESNPSQEWVSHVPSLSLPEDNQDAVKTPQQSSRDTPPSRLNLFALSSDMPSSLRGGLARVPEESIIDKPSVTIVSEYIHGRDLRLREPSFPTTKKSSDDLQNIKQTILQTRASNNEGINNASSHTSACHVADRQVIPVPSWEAGINCTNYSHNDLEDKNASSRHKNITNSQINEMFSSSVRLHVEHDLLPGPVLRGSSPFRRSKVPPNLLSGKQNAVSSKQTAPIKPKPSKPDSAVSKKPCSKLDSSPKRPCIKTYNHSTRDVRSVPYSNKSVPLVTRDTVEEDAFSLAIKESQSTSVGNDRGRQKIQSMRNRVAVSKEAIDKEYEETMAFLKTLPKDSRPIKRAYLDDKRQQAQNERKQRLLQYEFKKIQKDCRKHSPTNKQSRSKSKSPTKLCSKDAHTSKDFQYSWMPVPDGDNDLVVHTIPTDINGKGNTVKFADIDSYHQYRSRHKHTPPTKDTAGKKTTVTERDYNSTDSSSGSTSDISSLEDQSCEQKNKSKDENSSDLDRIIIYKILDSKLKHKSAAKNSKLLKKIAKCLSSSSKETMKNARSSDEVTADGRAGGKTEATPSLDQLTERLTEGIYKTVSEKGDNIRTMRFIDMPPVGDGMDGDQRPECSCRVSSKSNTGVQWVCGDDSPTEKMENSNKCKCKTKSSSTVPSYQTAKDVRRADKEHGYIKLLDHIGNEAGKFCIGASGYLKDDDYEVIIQLRKKDLKEKKDENQTEIKSPTVIDEKKSDAKHLQPLKQAEKSVNVPSSSEDISKVSYERVQSQEQGINTETVSSDDQNNNTPLETQSVDRGVCTTFEETTQAKTDIQRPATSTSTQTTLGSPIHRPVFYHMSSSTSTAYMSPPDNILPHYLNRDQHVNYVTVDMHEPPNEDFDMKDCEDSCSCRHCVQTKRLVNELKSLHHAHQRPNRSVRHSSGSHTYLKAPPNTARSSTLGDNDAAQIYSPRSRSSKSPSISSSVKRATPKKDDNPTPKTCSKPRKCKKAITPAKRSASSVAQSTLSRRINKKIVDKQSNKANLKPVVKKYVDKLLTLNKAGMKAVEVMNQDCSVVPTPSSSIVNVPRNIDDVATVVNDEVNLVPKISLEQLKEAIVERLIQQGTNAAYSNIATKKKPSVHFPTKKSVHKVKSLKISKHFSRTKSDATRDTENGRSTEPTSTSSTKDNIPERNEKCMKPSKIRSKSTPSPRRSVAHDLKCKSNSSDMVSFLKLDQKYIQAEKVREYLQVPLTLRDFKESQTTCKRKSKKSASSEMSLPDVDSMFGSKSPNTISTQTSITNELNFMKIAEGKLHNMEKIADLTEKCTMRLSNLAKVLDEVRKSKSNHRHTQVSSSEIDIGHSRKLPLRTCGTDTQHHGRDVEGKGGKANVEVIIHSANVEDHKENNRRASVEYRKVYNRRENVEEQKEVDNHRSSVKDHKEVDHLRANVVVHTLHTEDNNHRASLEVHKEVDNRRASVENHKEVDNQRANVEVHTLHTEDNNRRASSEVHKEIDNHRAYVEVNKDDNHRTREEDHKEYNRWANVKDHKEVDYHKASVDYHKKVDNRRENLDYHKEDEYRMASVEGHKDQDHDRKVVVDLEIDNNRQKESSSAKVDRRNLSDRGTSDSAEYVSFLADIPKPNRCKSPVSGPGVPPSTSSDATPLRNRGKPPPALLRKNLKHAKEDVVPHELSTVVEVDSPLSLRQRNQLANNGDQARSHGVTVENNGDSSTQRNQDQLHKNEKDSQNTSKAQMMDFKSFNDIMLKPFMTVEEYARQCNINVEEGSKMDSMSRPADLIHDDVSSLHSDNSLPDVIAELLKRNIISEPFKYDTASNVNSTTASTESSLSALVLSKIRHEQQPKVIFEKAETSDSTLSVSSNPDLENAFKQLGMGWASSTLKKTKERLALSSSSTTSSSSLTHFKFKSSRGEIPVLVTDIVSSVVSLTRKKEAEQQTSHSKSMTVKQFLAKELANKITFTDKSRRDDTAEEFVSLFETKLPENMKHSAEKSAESGRSLPARARTSTPVQLFKSVTYHSSSASNGSNCLFSNADDLSSVKGTSNDNKNHSSDKDDLTIPNYSLRTKRTSDCSKSD